jgi:hypothetical protein
MVKFEKLLLEVVEAKGIETMKLVKQLKLAPPRLAGLSCRAEVVAEVSRRAV